MSRFMTFMLLSGFLLWSGRASDAQDLFNGPEGVVFDSIGNRYFVANALSGNIVEIDHLGQQRIFKDSLSVAIGLHIAGDVLYVSTNRPYTLMGLDMTSGEIVSLVPVTPVGGLSGITSDTSGHLYVVDQGGQIFTAWPDSDLSSILVNYGLPYGPQGIHFDALYNRLIVVGFGLNTPIVAVNLADTSISLLTTTTIGQFIGITTDPDRNYYVSSWRTNCVHRWDCEFQEPPEMFSSGHSSPTGVCYNAGGNVFVVCNFGSSTVDFIPLVEGLNEPGIPAHIGDWACNYPNPFNAETSIRYSLERPAHVTIDIFDVLGRRIETLTPGLRTAGEHWEVWDAAGHASGTYFYRLDAGDMAVTKTMALVK